MRDVRTARPRAEAHPPRAGTPAEHAGSRAHPALPSLCLIGLHLLSRRAPVVVIALGACGALLATALHWHWISAGGGGQRIVPMLLEAGAASLVAMACISPFGEPERATGRWLPWLRLGTALGLTATAFGLLAAGAAAGGFPGGDLALLRDLGGITGIALLVAVLLGGSLAWLGPMAYVILIEVAFADSWHTPWIWPARPPHDHGAALCAALVFAAGMLVITVRGARDSIRE